MVFFQSYGARAYFSGINSTETGVKHVGVNIGTFNSNAVHALAATYTNTAAQTALTYLDGSLNRGMSVDDSWSVTESRMIIGDNKLTTYRPAYGELYALRFYDRELTAEELAADAAIDQKRIFAPRVMTWKNLVDGNFCTSGKWNVSGTGGQNIPRYSDRVFLPDGDYAVTLDEDWVIGELSVGAGATLKIALPEHGNGTYGVVPLTVGNGVTADAAAKLDLDVAAFNKAHNQESATLITCGTTSTAALQTLADSFNTSAGKTLVTVEGGTRLVYTAPPPAGTMVIFR